MKVPLLLSNLKIGDVFFVRRDVYGSEWNGCPMVVESIYETLVGGSTVVMRYQGHNSVHDTVRYNMESMDKYLEPSCE